MKRDRHNEIWEVISMVKWGQMAEIIECFNFKSNYQPIQLSIRFFEVFSSLGALRQVVDTVLESSNNLDQY